MHSITFGSLFAGIGGFDLGFERAGMQCKWQVEIDDYANKVLAKHWPKVHREKDIRECGSHNLEWVDVVAGGFPCQDISYAGRGAGLAGERSGLFFEAVRVVRELQPRFVVLENVAALLTRGMDRVLGTLAEIGYDAEWHCIPAAYVGAPHIRDRVFIVANARCELRESRPSEGSASNAPAKRGSTSNEHQRCSEDVANASSNRWEQRRQDGRRGKERTSKRQEYRSGSGSEDVANANSSGCKNISGCKKIAECSWKRTFSRASWWDVEPDVGRVANGIPSRVDRLRGLGNAVVPQVAELVGRWVVEKLA